MITLDDMADRAQRHLDGMTVNKDAMARDVLKLVEAIRGMQKRAQAQPRPQAGGFAEAFDDVLSGIFNGRSQKP